MQKKARQGWSRLLIFSVLLSVLCFSSSVLAAEETAFGNINLDNAINATDALIVLQHQVRLTTLNEDEMTRGDVDADGDVDASDALLILQYAVKLIDRFPADTAEEPSEEPGTTTDPDQTQTEFTNIYDDNGIAYTLSDGYLWVSSEGTCTQKNIIIPNSVNGKPVIGIFSSAFSSNSVIESVTLSEGLTTVQQAAFLGCSHLQTVNLPSTLKTIESHGFMDCAITSINLPDGLEVIGKGAFKELKMKQLTIPASVHTIGDGAFRASALEEITILGNATLGSNIFNKCKNLASVTLPEGITAIPSQAFYNCSSLTTLNIPSSIISFGSSAFYGCDKLTISQLTVNTDQNYHAFSDLKIGNVDVYANLDRFAFNGAKIQKLTIHEGVTTLEDSAFSRAFIESVSFPSTLSEVKGSAFYGCNVEEVVFTGPVSLGHSAFKNSTVKEVALPAGSILGLYVFSGCAQLETIRYGGTMQQWQQMTQYDRYKELNKATVICSDGTILPQ